MQTTFGREMVLGRFGQMILLGFCLMAPPAMAIEASPGAKVGSPPTSGDTVCTISKVADPYFSDRSRVVLFPDGREMTVIGLTHGNRDLRGGAADRLSKAKTSIEVSRIVAAESAAIADAREGVRFLRSNPGRYKFIAAEAAPETVILNLKSYAALKSRLAKFKELGEQAMLLAFGPDFYFHLSNPKSSRLIGVEDRALGESYLRSLPEMEKQMTRLKSAKFDADTADRLSEFLNSLTARYAEFRPESDDSLREARKRFTAQDFAKIETFLRARLDVMRAMKARDRYNVTRLVAQASSGVLFIGSSHLDSTASLLRDECRAIGAK